MFLTTMEPWCLILKHFRRRALHIPISVMGNTKYMSIMQTARFQFSLTLFIKCLWVLIMISRVTKMTIKFIWHCEVQPSYIISSEINEVNQMLCLQIHFVNIL